MIDGNIRRRFYVFTVHSNPSSWTSQLLISMNNAADSNHGRLGPDIQSEGLMTLAVVSSSRSIQPGPVSSPQYAKHMSIITPSRRHAMNINEFVPCHICGRCGKRFRCVPDTKDDPLNGRRCRCFPHNNSPHTFCCSNTCHYLSMDRGNPLSKPFDFMVNNMDFLFN